MSAFLLEPDIAKRSGKCPLSADFVDLVGLDWGVVP
jgi:hypothetical protein